MTLLLLGCIGGLSDKWVIGEDPTDTSVPLVDTAPSSDVDCDEDLTEGVDTCFTGALTCGDRVLATNQGGTQLYTDLFYESAYCFVPYESYLGPERIWEIEFDGAHQADVVLAAPCEDMALAIARWEPTDSCPPEEGHQILECEGMEASAGGRVTLSSPSGARYLVMVDGPEANFELWVECS